MCTEQTPVLTTLPRTMTRASGSHLFQLSQLAEQLAAAISFPGIPPNTSKKNALAFWRAQATAACKFFLGTPRKEVLQCMKALPGPTETQMGHKAVLLFLPP